MQKIIPRYTIELRKVCVNIQNSLGMNKETLNQIIIKYYNEWLKYTCKIAANRHLETDAHDILQQVLLDILDKNANDNILLTSAKADEEELIRRYIQKSIKINIISPKSYWNRQKAFDRKNLNHNVDFDLLCIPDIEEPEDNRTMLIWNTFDQLELPEKKRRIFQSYYRKGQLLKQCKGQASIATVSRVCKCICKKIYLQLKQKNMP